MDRGIFKTIIYYDSLDYPLTPKELELFSFKDDKELKADDLVELSGGFHFLKGRSKLVQIRKERNEIAEEKWDKALKAVRWLRLVPYIRAVFASGSLALSNTDKNADLDVLIVIRNGRIWTARFLAVILLDLLGLRRKAGQKSAPNKLCLNHFITEKSLHIPYKSIYTAQLYARLVPILGDEKLIEEFCEANKWVEEYVPKFKIQSPTASKSKAQNYIKKIGEKILDTKFGDWAERILKKYQLRRINKNPLTHKPGGRVKVDDESLEFHPDSPELRIIERYNGTMIELEFPELAKEPDSGLTR